MNSIKKGKCVLIYENYKFIILTYQISYVIISGLSDLIRFFCRRTNKEPTKVKIDGNLVQKFGFRLDTL